MQGRHIKHSALRAYNVSERITMVTSFRAKDPLIHDGSILDTIKPISKRHRLNFAWTLYRLKLLSDRFGAMAAKLEEKKASFGADDDADGMGGSEVVNVEEMSKWIDQQLSYITVTKEQYML